MKIIKADIRVKDGDHPIFCKRCARRCWASEAIIETWSQLLVCPTCPLRYETNYEPPGPSVRPDPRYISPLPPDNTSN